MSTAQEIEEAIRSLSATERGKLLHDLPIIFPELGGDAEWDRIIQGDKPRRALTKLINETEADYGNDAGKFPPMTSQDFDPKA
jgi:hypothetical protein